VYLLHGTVFASFSGERSFFPLIPAAMLHTLEFGMSELLSPLRSQEHAVIFESLQARLREMTAARPTDAGSSPAVKMQVRPGPRMLDDAEAAASMSQVRTETQHVADMTAIHSGLDPQRVAKLLALLE
jgi:hypothetical protein